MQCSLGQQSALGTNVEFLLKACVPHGMTGLRACARPNKATAHFAHRSGDIVVRVRKMMVYRKVRKSVYVHFLKLMLCEILLTNCERVVHTLSREL